MSPCKKCESKCCRYFALQIDTPRTKEEFENIRWYLAHKGVTVFIEKRRWHLEISTRCRYLTKDHRCKVYEKRPLICREYSSGECHTARGEFGHDKIFRNMKEFDRYLDKRFKRR